MHGGAPWSVVLNGPSLYRAKSSCEAVCKMNALIGFGGALPIIAVLLWIFRAQLRRAQKIAVAVLIYVLSVATGIVSDVVWSVGDTPSALLAGIGAPILYCILFALATVVIGSARQSAPVVKSSASSAGAAAGSTATSPWAPVIVAAVIQAVGTVVAALLAR